MNCIICNSNSSYYFSKIYSEAPIDAFMKDIGRVDYYKCECCGFVLSKTHRELSETRWGVLNQQFHHYMENPAYEKKVNQPPYAEQALMLVLLEKNGIVNAHSMLDYAAGYGTLSNILNKYHNVELPIFDEYVQDESSGKYVDKKDLKTYKVVFNSAMFEHALTRSDLDSVNNLVDDDGCLIIHTVICENIPNDPSWFYLRPPVHTAFHTNKSMAILMEQWGYESSLYCPQSKCWVLFKKGKEDLTDKITAINKELQSDWFIYKKGFVDYWKGF